MTAQNRQKEQNEKDSKNRLFFDADAKFSQTPKKIGTKLGKKEEKVGKWEGQG